MMSTQQRPVIRRASLVGVAALTAGALFAGAAPALASHAAETRAASVSATEQTPELTAEQLRFIEDGMGPEAMAELNRAISQGDDGEIRPRAFPIAAVAIGAAAWCAKGAVASIPTSVLSDVADGKFSGKGTYVKNAIIGCLGGEIGGVVWKFLPGWVKNKAVSMVAAFIIKYIR
ncbi:hypothetical protein [Streptomyces formicae]|uniref:Secreted protein n=1 Tax=Streptomyces formicae TaxID=1616117 RepID=A0A291QML8_9ACTN|nr:hypothetical protein [Streptomyces formicae]ATL32949.1 hypothetical protein KY5_7931c [Streptomyces formicae]